MGHSGYGCYGQNVGIGNIDDDSRLEIIVTSALESACGIATLAHLAAAVAPDAVHGLATGEWLVSDTGLLIGSVNGLDWLDLKAFYAGIW